MKYGRAIRIVRAAYGLTQKALADRTSISPSHLSLIESEKRDPSLKVLQEICDTLGVPMHLMTLLASDSRDIDDKKNADQIAEVARALLYVLASAGEQPTLPISHRGKRD